ncbi:NADPH-dependent 7-cyano-7-deazaguanine reductase QueF [Marinospirillum sp.]|uniref:NADPH-dependent 7-cyano-7-deazaguanine reductase QueF n=1 Tax=Marinospirillum sp. TaxID=2183934 RepID=UPI00286FCE43|nr:NADPH-dependent 7-cyano-7-deazaguanine reductase QueF [Marinospirillum sp.]MDR9469032.1 NADPH-dependent 7-cyano-7-deazaguanine reductase QueF [Marinospirillum sp.]
MPTPSVETSPLGKETQYCNQYNPELLHPLPRLTGRKSLGLSEASLPFQGVDIWNAYEISWLNSKGKPLVRLAEFRFPADSSHIIESKSFKLYLNSFNLTSFASEQQVREQMQQDLSQASGSQVAVVFFAVDAGLTPQTLQGECLDDLDITANHYTPAPELLTTQTHQQVEETLVSHLLKSNCPVTGQPDWASVQIHYLGPKLDREGLLAYLISYREKGDFHEHCVEEIFLDLLRACQPEQLTVYARYLRRGGLDINPWRSTLSSSPANLRLLRQ